MLLPIAPAYNDRMSQSRTTTGILLVVLLAVIGYVLCDAAAPAGRRLTKAAEISPWVGYVYLAVVGIGGLLLASLLIAILMHIWKNTRQKSADARAAEPEPERNVGRPSGPQEFADNLAAGQRICRAAKACRRELRAEIAAAVAELEAKRESQQLEIVAFGTISSGKSSLLNALAGRDVFRTNVVGGTTTTRSEIPWPAGDRVVLVDTPGLAEVRGEARAAEVGRGGEECRPRAVRRRRAAQGLRARAARSARRDGEADRRLPQQGRLVRRRAARRAACGRSPSR